MDPDPLLHDADPDPLLHDVDQDRLIHDADPVIKMKRIRTTKVFLNLIFKPI